MYLSIILLSLSVSKWYDIWWQPPNHLSHYNNRKDKEQYGALDDLTVRQLETDYDGVI